MQPGTLARWLMVFDLDGTLVDTAPDLIAALNVTLASEGLKAVKPDKTLRQQVGKGASALIEHGAARSGVYWSEDRIAELTRYFLETYAENIAEHSRSFPGAEAVMKRLQAAGAHLAVCTNKEGELARKLLKALKLDHGFSAIVGHDEVPNHKPHGDHLRACVSRAGGDLTRSIMIGDTSSDVGTARHAGSPVILVDFGYSLIPVTELGADAVISDFEALDGIVARLVTQRS